MKHFKVSYRVVNECIKYFSTLDEVEKYKKFTSFFLSNPFPYQMVLSTKHMDQPPPVFESMDLEFKVSVEQGNYVKGKNGEYIPLGKVYKLPDGIVKYRQWKLKQPETLKASRYEEALKTFDSEIDGTFVLKLEDFKILEETLGIKEEIDQDF